MMASGASAGPVIESQNPSPMSNVPHWRHLRCPIPAQAVFEARHATHCPSLSGTYTLSVLFFTVFIVDRYPNSIFPIYLVVAPGL